jgi:NAD kinase
LPKLTSVYTVEKTPQGTRLVAIDGSLTVNLREGQVLDFGRSLHAIQVVGAQQPAKITWFSTARRRFTGNRCGK